MQEANYETNCIRAGCSSGGGQHGRLQGPVSGQADGEAAPIYGIKIPVGYRDWKLISVAHEEGNLNDLRAQLGTDVAIEAFREGKLPFPDGTIIAALHWHYVPSEENNKVFSRAQSFIAGAPKNIQLMVKDSKKYAATDGWGFAKCKPRQWMIGDPNAPESVGPRDLLVQLPSGA